MRIIRKVSWLVLLFVMTMSITALAKVPNGTVVIGTKAYSLNYANNEKNLDEIRLEIISGKKIYIKGLDGQWYDTSIMKEVSKDVIPMLTYKDANGKIMEYASKDGEEISFKVLTANYVNSNQLKIKFNKKVDAKTALNRLNYKIGGKALSNQDSIKFEENQQAVLITLDEKISNSNLESSLCVSKKVCDIEKKYLLEDYNQNILILNKGYSSYSAEKVINSDVHVLEDGITLKNLHVKGNIYIQGNNILVDGGNIEGDLVIDPGERGNSYISKIKAEGIYVLSGLNKSIHINDVTASKLEVNSKNKNKPVRVEIKGKSNIITTTINSECILDVEKSGNLSKLNISPKDKNSTVQLLGSFPLVEICKEAKVHFKTGEIEKIIINSNANIIVSDEVKIKEVDKKDNIVNIEKEEDVQQNNQSGGSGGSTSSDGSNDGESSEKPYITDASILLEGEGTVKISISDGVSGSVDISDIGSKKIKGISINVSKSDCTFTAYNPTNLGLKKLTRQSSGKNFLIDSDASVTLTKLRTIAASTGDDYKVITVKGEVQDDDGNNVDISIDVRVRK